MYILGVESTAHTFGVGIVTDKGKVLANAKDSFKTETGGMIPDQVAAHHKEVAPIILEQAFKQAKLTWKDIKFIAYSAGPGLDPALWTGYHIVKEWAKEHNKEIVGVNHCCAHLSIGKIVNKAKDPIYLYVSGVNTQVIVQENGTYYVLGETLDIGLGNMFDKLGRVMGLGFPAGPVMDKIAAEKKGKYIELPYIVKGMDVSFSGLLTKAEQLYKQKKATVEDLCYSIQETSYAMCIEVVERGIANTGKKELILVGGVGASKRFCEMLQIMCNERKAIFYNVPMDLAGDQGAMIAWEGFLRSKYSKEKVKKYGDASVQPHWRADEV